MNCMSCVAWTTARKLELLLASTTGCKHSHWTLLLIDLDFIDFFLWVSPFQTLSQGYVVVCDARCAVLHLYILTVDCPLVWNITDK